MRKPIVVAVLVIVVLLALARWFQVNLTLSFGNSVVGTPTLTHEEELRAPFETARAELNKITPTK